jgi:hypothetical protein
MTKRAELTLSHPLFSRKIKLHAIELAPVFHQTL